MFNKNSKSRNEALLSADNITTLIGENCVVEGSIKAGATMKIDGHIHGSVEGSGGVILGQNSLVEGDVRTRELIVCGKIEGNVFAETLMLKETAEIAGDITAHTLQMETGAVYNGKVTMKSGAMDD